MRILMAPIRWVLGTMILFFDRVFTPKPMARSPKRQKQVDQETSHLALYQFESCPFCVKVRRAMKRLNLKIELRDAKKSPQHAEDLVRGGGELQVPCLQIRENGNTRWMYESDQIIQYLTGKFAS